MCTSKLDYCVKNININDSHCLPACEGVLVTSYTKTLNTHEKLDDVIGNIVEEYDIYKGKVEYPSGLKGKLF